MKGFVSINYKTLNDVKAHFQKFIFDTVIRDYDNVLDFMFQEATIEETEQSSCAVLNINPTLKDYIGSLITNYKSLKQTIYFNIKERSKFYETKMSLNVLELAYLREYEIEMMNLFEKYSRILRDYETEFNKMKTLTRDHIIIINGYIFDDKGNLIEE